MNQISIFSASRSSKKPCKVTDKLFIGARPRWPCSPRGAQLTFLIGNIHLCDHRIQGLLPAASLLQCRHRAASKLLWNCMSVEGFLSVGSRKIGMERDLSKLRGMTKDGITTQWTIQSLGEKKNADHCIRLYWCRTRRTEGHLGDVSLASRITLCTGIAEG